MTVYILLFSSIIICSLIEIYFPKFMINNKSYETKKYISIFLFILMMIIGVFRYEYLGVDVNNYSIFFHDSDNLYSWFRLFTDFRMDNGYYLLNKVFKIVFDNYWIFKSFLFILTFSIYYCVIVKDSKYVSLSMLVFIGIERMVGIFCLLRQEVAMAILFYSIKYIRQHNLFKFIICIVLAMTFHKTAIAFLFAYFFINFKEKDMNFSKFKFVQLPILTFVFGYFIILSFTKIYPIDYLNDITFGNGIFKLSYIVMLIILSYLTMKLCKFNDKELEEISIYFKISFCSIFPQILTLFLPVFTRVTNYFLLGFVILIPNLFYYMKLHNSRYTKYAILFLYILFGFLYFYSLIDNIVPYQFQF